MQTQHQYHGMGTIISETKGAWRRAGIKAYVRVKKTNHGRTTVVKFRVGGEHGFFADDDINVRGGGVTLGIKPTNSPEFYAALAVFFCVYGLDFRVIPTTLREPLREVLDSGTVRITPVIDKVMLETGDRLLRRVYLSPVRYE